MQSNITEHLRKAARVMRGHAQEATPGPWTATGRYPYLVIQGDESMVSTNLAVKPAADAAYIAGWQPSVALAVAAWLDSVAFAAENTPTGLEVAGLGHAVAVATAYLADPATEGPPS